MLDTARDYQRAKRMKVASNSQAAVNHMHETVEHRLAQLLLARFILLCFLIREANNTPGGLQEKVHRRLWVLLQARPTIFSADFDVDIFADLANLLRGSSIHDLKSCIRFYYRELLPFLKPVRNPATDADETPPLFCVLDEAQATTTLHMGDFMSDDRTTNRPILREIWLLWSTILNSEQMRLVLSATGIKLQALKETLASSALKLHSYMVKSDIGAFEKSESQAEYIKRYVPACWANPDWAEFLARSWRWFHGR
jgi:hypothetical protein